MTLNYQDDEFDFEKWIKDLKKIMNSEWLKYIPWDVSEIIWKSVLTPSEFERRKNESDKIPSFEEIYPEVDTERSIRLRKKYWL